MRGTKVKILRGKRAKLSKAAKSLVNAQALTNASQRPKFKKERVNKRAGGHGPTWPRTDDQKAQSRPVIYLRPIRALKIDAYMNAVPDENGVRDIPQSKILAIQQAVNWPKHAITQLLTR